ncbi:hypothetical protein [Roseibium sp. M-1]
MTAVEGVQSTGRPLDLAAAMQGPGTAKEPKPARNAAVAEDKGSSFSFGDFIDVINPLQHIPGVAELYRAVTNDRISDEARKTGNALYGFALGGPVGLGAMLAYNAVGDRFKGPAEPSAGNSATLAEVHTPEPVTEQSEVPVPAPKPSLDPDRSPAMSEVTSQMLLGETVASTGAKQALADAPALANLLTGGNADKPVRDGNGSSVSYLDLPPKLEEAKPVLPDKAGLDSLAAHKANHLPLDVLKALQERHAQRSASERT